MFRISLLFVLSASLLFQSMAVFSQNSQQALPHPDARDYAAPLTENDKGNIRYLILTLANKSQFSLLFAKGRLNRAGNAVSHVHPLVFFEYVFTDPQLKSAVKRINGIPWRRFVEGMGESFAKESARNNITPEHLQDFADKVRVDYSILVSSAEKNRWEDFINITRNNLP